MQLLRGKWSTKSCLESYVFQELIKDSRAKVLRPYSQATRRNTIFQSESFLGASVALGFCICFFFGPKANTSVQIMVESKYIFVEAIYPFITFFIHSFIYLLSTYYVQESVQVLGMQQKKTPDSSYLNRAKFSM